MTEPAVNPFVQPKLSFAAASAFSIVGELINQLSPSTEIHPRLTFPCGGFYVCLSLVRGYAPYESICDFNLLSGCFHTHSLPSPEVELWPEPRSYCLASVSEHFHFHLICSQILGLLGLTRSEETDEKSGNTYRVIGMLLSRFIFEDGMVIENGYRKDEHFPQWILDAPEEWRWDNFNDYAAGQFWRVSKESTDRSVILWEEESVLLVGRDEYLPLYGDLRLSVDRMEKFLRAEL